MATLEVPLFPLGIVLFPGAPQLLHIFEPRYRQMLADCLESDQPFGVSYVTADGDDDPSPDPGNIGCLATVRESRLLADGRSNILAVGSDRYVLRAYVPTDLPYRMARVETFDDEDLTAPQLEELATRARTAFSQFIAGMQALTDRPQESVPLESAPQAVSFQIAAVMDLEPALKQELLELRSEPTRLRRLVELLARAADALAAEREARIRASGNGKVTRG